LRADTLAAWLDGLGLVAKTKVIQPYYVVIGPGEYSAEACIPIWDGVFDGISDAFVRFDPTRLRWEGQELVQLDMEYTPFPRQVLLPNGLPGCFNELIHSGLLAPVSKPKTSGILLTLHDALWSRKPHPNLKSTWVRALFDRVGRDELTDAEAVRCIYQFVIWSVEQNPVVEARIAALHRHWGVFKQYAVRSSKGALRYLTPLSPLSREPAAPLVIPLPCHWLAETQDKRSFYCPTCFDYKGYLFDRMRCRPPPKNKKNKKPPAPVHSAEGEFIRRGSHRVAFCFKTRRELCRHEKTSGRKSPKSLCIAPLVHLDIFGCAVQDKGHVSYRAKGERISEKANP
jgi:hypothetical protein